jgi:uncharacterized protein (DUF2147 family)
MKKFLLACLFLLFSFPTFANDSITGFWTTIDDETKTAKSVVQIYEYQGKYFGRVVELFKNKEAVAKIKGYPKIKNLDIIWDLEKKGAKYKGGEILDPTKGKIYGCEIWREGDKLIVRGKIAFLGRNQTWLPNTDFKPEESTEKLIPKKPL